jgi:colanic acid/amylovoran biosynthesis glycosyltransferase
LAVLLPKRVAYVVKRYPRFSETFVISEILAHEQAGLELDIISLYPPNDTHFQDVLAKVRSPVTYLSTSGLKAPELWAALQGASKVVPDFWSKLETVNSEAPSEIYQAALLAKLIVKKQIEHVHAHFATTATTVARLAAYFADIPYSFTAHAKDIFHDSVQKNELSQKLSDASAVVTVSDFNVAFLQEQYGSLSSKMQRIYNGLDLEKFSFEAPVQRLPLIVGVGRLVEKKGFLDLLESCAILVKRGCVFWCEIIGEGEEKIKLERCIADLQLGNYVRLFGARPQQEVMKKIQEASVFALPCVIGEDGNRDGLPTVLLEAMALGTACVSKDVTGIPEILHHEETGLQVPQQHPALLADALERLLLDTELRVQLALTARGLIEREFDIKHNAAQVRELFARAKVSENHFVATLHGDQKAVVL